MRGARSGLGRALPGVLFFLACAREPTSASVTSSAAGSSSPVTPSRRDGVSPVASSDADVSPATSSAPAAVASASDASFSARLARTGPLGVPVHAEPRDRTDFYRVPDGTLVEASPIEAANWLRVVLRDGRVGYVVRRYVVPAEVDATKAEAIGNSRDDCERSLAGSVRRPGRVGTFNVRWFPDGGRGTKSDGAPTDVDWLACALLRTEASVLALQEWTGTPRAEAATKRLLARLGEKTKTPWKIELDECREGGAQRVALLWNTGEATLEDVRTIADFNPHGRACERKNRPGLAARVRLGERRFEFVAVHFKSGTDARSFGMRDTSFQGLGLHAKRTNGPLVVAGDFNTMGCEDCAPPVSAEEERRARDGFVRTLGGEFLPDAPSCSHYFGDDPGLLDGFALFGLEAGSVTVGGECARSACKATTRGEFHRTVSDHCPLALSFGAP